jgi:hypothetical protein
MSGGLGAAASITRANCQAGESLSITAIRPAISGIRIFITTSDRNTSRGCAKNIANSAREVLRPIANAHKVMLTVVSKANVFIWMAPMVPLLR